MPSMNEETVKKDETPITTTTTVAMEEGKVVEDDVGKQPEADEASTVPSESSSGPAPSSVVLPSTRSTSSRPRRAIIVVTLVVLLILGAIGFGIARGVQCGSTKASSSLQTGENNNSEEDGHSKVLKLGTSQLPLFTDLGTAAFATYESCAAAETDLTELLRNAYVAMLEQRIREQFHRDYDSSCTGCGLQGITAFFNSGTAGAPNSRAQADSATTQQQQQQQQHVATEDSFWTTNQVGEALDEADFVQSDGDLVFAIYGAEIIKLDARQVQVLSRTPLVPDPTEYYSVAGMLLAGDSLVVFATLVPMDTYDDTGGGHDADQEEEDQDPVLTHIFVYDKQSMQVQHESTAMGMFVSARSVDNENIHLVTASFNMVDIFYEIFDPPTYTATEEVYRQQGLEAFELKKGEIVQDLLDGHDCTSIQQVALFSNTNDIFATSYPMANLVTVTSFSVRDPAATSTRRTVVMPSYDWRVYASSELFVVSVTGFNFDSATNTTSLGSYLMGYSLDGPSLVGQSTGTLPGYVLNEFSIHHEHKDDKDLLYVATTSVSAPASSNFGLDIKTTSQVSILEVPNDGTAEMALLGQAAGLGKKDEHIHSVRFQRDRAFVSTYIYTDPFYTLDISDPTNPQQVGELEFNGFANYLHPIGENLMLGIGQEAVDGQERGYMISLFDVSDLDSPALLHSLTEANDAGRIVYSISQQDHRALRFFDTSNILIVPISIDSWDSEEESFDGFHLYKIDETEGITRYFTIEHGSEHFHDGCWSPDSFLNPRSLVFDRDVMTLRAHSILSYDLDTKLPHADRIDLDEELTKCSTEYFAGDNTNGNSGVE